MAKKSSKKSATRQATGRFVGPREHARASGATATPDLLDAKGRPKYPALGPGAKVPAAVAKALKS